MLHEPGFADPARAVDSHQTSALLVKHGHQTVGHLDPVEKFGHLGRQIVEPATGQVGKGKAGAEIAGLDAVGQFLGLGIGFEAQFVPQNLPALFELGQGGAGLAVHGQQQHQVAMGLLAQRVQAEQAGGGRHAAQRVVAL